MKESELITDGIGRPIEFGKKYAYLSNSNGFTSNFIGIADKVTPSGKISVNVIERYTALYTDNVVPTNEGPYKHVAVKPNLLIKL